MKTIIILFFILLVIFVVFAFISVILYRKKLRQKQELKAGDYISFKSYGDTIFGRIITNYSEQNKIEVVAFGTKYMVDYKNILL